MPANIILISGSDEQAIITESAKVFKAFAGENPDAFAVDIYSEGEGGPTPELIYQVISALNTIPMLDTRTIWLKHYSGFSFETDKKTSEPNAAALKALGELLKQGLPANLAFVMDGPGLDIKRSLYKTVSQVGKVTILNKPELSQKNCEAVMRGCLRASLEEKGMRLEPAAEDYLLDALGTDNARIPQELEKILCYRGSAEGTVCLEEVEAVVVGKGEEMVWALSDVLGKRDIKEAFRVIDVLLTQSNDNDFVRQSMILNCGTFFRNAIRIRVFMGENKLATPVALENHISRMSEEQKKSAASRGMDFITFHPFRIKNLAMQAMKYSPQEIIGAIQILKDAIWQVRSSATDSRMALENALLAIMGTTTPARYR